MSNDTTGIHSKESLRLWLSNVAHSTRQSYTDVFERLEAYPDDTPFYYVCAGGVSVSVTALEREPLMVLRAKR
ncbi:TPA: hypothetical protein N2N50_000522 [Kluyvera ascorbata]|nr:hypothetical protein STW0522KLE44_21130 [Klebsiella sp. STW0522-44]HAT7514040.1 hypothetical protein [Kluyvera ascorbata]HCL5619566.1 hypothetical protein [Kluyvera ascorbata]HED3201555.1 hypothetical protein [Kluyvera ascorbata]HED4085401.1 hypothetical protein [Kluyvera ascorbata]